MKKSLFESYPVIFLILITAFPATAKDFANQKTAASTDEYVVQAYLPFWHNDYKPDPKILSRFTHIALAFAVPQPNGEVTFEQSFKNNLDVTLQSIAEAKKINPNLKCLWAIGGWGNSNNFTSAVSDLNRKVFVKNLLKLIETYKCNGIDLDWEYPKAEDRDNLTKFISELNAEISARKNNYQITMAIGSAGGEHTAGIELKKIAPFLHHLNLMTYDFHGSWSQIAGHHTGTFKSSRVVENLNVEAGIKYFLEENFPSKKIVIGAAFYGRAQGAVEAGKSGDGLGEKSSGAGNFMFRGKQYSSGISYRELKTLPGDWKRFFDKEARAPYLYNAQNKVFISYEDPRSLSAKIELVKNRNLGGIMLWELTEDAGDELTGVLLRGFGR